MLLYSFCLHALENPATVSRFLLIFHGHLLFYNFDDNRTRGITKCLVEKVKTKIWTLNSSAGFFLGFVWTISVGFHFTMHLSSYIFPWIEIELYKLYPFLAVQFLSALFINFSCDNFFLESNVSWAGLIKRLTLIGGDTTVLINSQH